MNRKFFATLFIISCIVSCKSVERYPDAKTPIFLKNKSALVAAQDRVSTNPAAENAYRIAAGDRAGSIYVLSIMPAPALELPVAMAKIGLEKKGAESPDALSQIALGQVLKAGARFGVKFDYIIFVTAERAGDVGPVTNVNHYAALYDISAKRVIAAAKVNGTTTMETTVDELPKGARRAVSLLLDGAE